MKKIAFVVAAASLFAFAPLAARFGPVPSSLALVWLGVLLAVLASGSLDALAIASGALGALGGGILASVSPAVAGAVFVAAAFAERTTRVRSRTARAVHVLLALVGGALAGALSSSYSGASFSVFTVAAVVAAVLASVPLLVEADDPVAHALEHAAALVGEPARRALLDGAELRRRAEDIPLDRATRLRVKKTWQSLLRLSEARIRLERRPHALLRIAASAPPPPPPVATAASEAAASGTAASETAASEAAASGTAASEAAASEAAASALPAAAPSTNAADAVLDMVDQRIVEHVTVLSRAFTAVDTVSAARIGLDDSAVKNVESVGESLDEVSRALVEVRGEGGAA